MKKNAFFICFLAALALVLSGCSAGRSVETHGVEVPEGWYISYYNSGVNYIEASEKTDKYSLVLDRKAESEEDFYYIKLAESIFPRKGLISAHLRQQNRPDPDLSNWYFERLWWFEEYQKGYIPFSVCGDSVNFYLDRYQSFKKRLKTTPSNQLWSKGNPNRIEFFYKARVVREGAMDKKPEPPPTQIEPDNQKESPKIEDAPPAQEEGPVRVILTMKWYEFCGQPCGWGFEKTREVVFESKTRVTKILGDGLTDKWVSTPRTPYAPHQWITF